MSTITQYFSPRNIPLIYWHQKDYKLPQPVLTVENCSNWKFLYLVTPDGQVSEIGFPPSPQAVLDLAKKHHWHMDRQAYHMIVGRWK